MYQRFGPKTPHPQSLPMNPKVRIELALTPALSPGRGRNCCRVLAIARFGFMGSMRELLGEISPHFAPPTPQNAEREKRSQRFAIAPPLYIRVDSCSFAVSSFSFLKNASPPGRRPILRWWGSQKL